MHCESQFAIYPTGVLNVSRRKILLLLIGLISLEKKNVSSRYLEEENSFPEENQLDKVVWDPKWKFSS